MESGLKKIKYEVFGIVQGVNFRLYTKEYAKDHSIKGWVKNTFRSTVIGEAEGEVNKIDEFKHWLRNIGSPSSSIIDAKFEEHQITQYSFNDFIIK